MQIAPSFEARVGRGAEALARALAYTGGAILVALALITLASIIGRWINTGPIRSIAGDYELVEAGVAIAVFSFLPWCQLRRGHVTVDIFTNALPGRARGLTLLLGDIVIAIVAYVVMWRFYLGFGRSFPISQMRGATGSRWASSRFSRRRPMNSKSRSGFPTGSH